MRGSIWDLFGDPFGIHLGSIWGCGAEHRTGAAFAPAHPPPSVSRGGAGMEPLRGGGLAAKEAQIGAGGGMDENGSFWGGRKRRGGR